MNLTNIKSIKIFIYLILLSSLCTPILAGVNYQLEDFEKKALQANVKLIKLDGKDYLKGSLSPNLNLGPIEVGFDLNLYGSLSDTSERPDELQPLFVLRRVAYDHNKQHGFEWGRLRNITLGYGLLVDDYDSGSAGTSEFTTKKAGFLGYTTHHPLRADVMYTATDVKALRLSYSFDNSPILGSPIVIGSTYISDSDGVNENYLDKSISRPAVNGLAFDAALPIAGDFLTFYTEYAQLMDPDNTPSGRGGSAGLRGSFFDQTNYRLEYRRLGSSFAPGYFNGTYEGTNFDASELPSKPINGYLASLSTELLNGNYRGGVVFESYEDRNPILTAAIGWSALGNTVGVINYRVPFDGKSNKVVNADILYKTGSWYDLEFHMKRTYLSSNTFMESWSFGTRVNVGGLFPNIPLIMN
jgi:hypothetical protein